MSMIDDLIAGAALDALSDAQLAALLARIAARLAAPPAQNLSDDRLLEADDAAARLGVGRSWLYRRSKLLPFVVRLDGKIRFSSRGIDRFIAAKTRR